MSPHYYGRELVGADRLREMLKDATIINLVGDGAISVAEEMGLCNMSDAKRVQGVPHLNIYYI